MFKAFFAILIIKLSFLGVGEDFVCFRDLFEFLSRIGVVSILVFWIR